MRNHFWNCNYKKMRKHSHRCRHCNKIIKTGEPVIMWKTGGGQRLVNGALGPTVRRTFIKTYAMHSDCADMMADWGKTYRESIEIKLWS